MTRLLSPLARRLVLAFLLSAPATALAADPPPDARQAASQSQQPALPAQALSAETLYLLLLGEIAGARGEIALAAEAYAKLARSTHDPRIARRATEMALFNRDTELAQETARLWAETDPHSEEARRVLAGVLAAQGDRVSEIQIELARIIASHPESLGANLMSLSTALAGIPDKKFTHTIIERLTEPYLDKPEAHFARAHALSDIGEHVAARAALDRALTLRPDWNAAVLFKAHIMANTENDSSGAVTLLEQWVKAHPDDVTARLGYARALVSDGELTRAHAEFQTLAALRPDDPGVDFAIGLLAAELGRDSEAVEHLERALTAGHGETDVIRMQLARIAAKRKDINTTLKWLDEVEDPERIIDARALAATTLAEAGRIDEARAQLHSIDTDEEGRKRLVMIEASMLSNVGHYAEALNLLDEALQSYPDDIDLLYQGAMIAGRVGRIDLLESRMRHILELDPEHAHALNALGYSLADHNQRLDEAEELIRRALKLLPDDPHILDSLGWVRYRRGDFAEAREHLERAYQLDKNPEIGIHLGEVLWAQGERDKARAMWDEVGKRDPQNELLLETIKRLTE